MSKVKPAKKSNEEIAETVPVNNIYFDLKDFDTKNILIDDEVTITVKGTLVSASKREGGSNGERKGFSVSIKPKDIELTKCSEGSVKNKSKMEDAYNITQDSMEDEDA